MQLYFLILTISLSLFAGEPVDEMRDTLDQSMVSSSIKLMQPVSRLSSPVSSVTSKEFEGRGLNSPKMLSSLVPNLHMPDYGTSMTSTIYMRGFGSRIDNPVLGLYIDDIPVLDKNNYELELMDIRRADLLRGPQGTLFGRNSLTGVLSICTLDPSAAQGGKAVLEYGSANTFLAKGSWYGPSLGIVAAYRHSDGFYVNEFDGRDIDRYDSFSMRLSGGKDRKDGARIDNTLSLSVLKQGGYPYRRLVDEGVGDPAYGGILLPVCYNGDSGYRRLSAIGGTRLRKDIGDYQMRRMSSVQVLLDRMDMDQDYTPESVFTLRQTQKQVALTHEYVFKPSNPSETWDWQSGAFAFWRYNNMDGPVHFLPDGVHGLILDKANAGIPDPYWLDFQEDDFVINSKFNIHTYNVALYHESYLTFGKLRLTAGLRLDHEGNFMKYRSDAFLNYIFTPIMKDYKGFEIVYEGNENNFYFELLPKLSAIYDFGSVNVFATISKGYKSGGFNTQLFSDILKGQMMTAMMDDLGVHFPNSDPGLGADATSYKPETCFNFETGVRYSKNFNPDHRLSASASAFYIDCTNQQITVFPPGKNTGRRMDNAGKSKSYGAEAELSWTLRNFSLTGSYGYVHATFKEYSDGNYDYSGNRIPYSPEQTLFVRGSYNLPISRGILHGISLSADVNGVGKIWWNEDNTYVQPFYALCNADVQFDFGKIDVYLRGRNLTGHEYDTFYFKSMGNSFLQHGKPSSYTAGIRYEF